jgi:FkbM family methyltransferase
MKLLFRRLLADRIFASALPLPRRLTLLDVGARGGVQWPWNRFQSELLSIVSVEPDVSEAARLAEQFRAAGTGTVLPVALWGEETTLSLNLTRSAGASSVYAPASGFLGQFPEAERFDVTQQVTVSAHTIDGLARSGSMPAVDFAKIDCQGAELSILQGGVEHLSSNAVGLELEVEFASMYADQPLFGDIDGFVRTKLGLELWDLRKTYWKYRPGVHAPGPVKGRLIFGDALYLRPLIGMEAWLQRMSPEVAAQKLLMLFATAIAYGYLDYAVAVLNAPLTSKYLDATARRVFADQLARFGRGFRPLRDGSHAAYFLFNALAQAFKPTHNGWASVEERLGSRRYGKFWS